MGNRTLTLAAASAAIGWCIVAASGDARAQSSCLLKEVTEELLAKIGVPTTKAQLLLLVLTVPSTAEPPDDQLTQTNPAFADKSGKQLAEESVTLEKAQQFVKTLPLTEDNQNCLHTIQALRDSMAKELRQREKENIPESESPNGLRSFRESEIKSAGSRTYTPVGPMRPSHRPGPGNSQPTPSVPPPPRSGCSGMECWYKK